MNNYILGPVDTDSISFCKPDMSPFSEEEKKIILEKLNELEGKLIRWEDDGTYEVVIVLKAKNYILYNEGKITLKGSSLKSSKIEPALKDLQKEIINAIIFNTNNYTEIYNKYVREACNIKDIHRWASKKSISEKTMTSERANETKIIDALAGKEWSEGDKVYMFFKESGELACVEDFDGNYDKDKMLEKIFKTCEIFKNVLNCKELFPNYKLKKNKGKLNEILQM